MLLLEVRSSWSLSDPPPHHPLGAFDDLSRRIHLAGATLSKLSGILCNVIASLLEDLLQLEESPSGEEGLRLNTIHSDVGMYGFKYTLSHVNMIDL